jgi:hypothetical protein
LLFVFGIAHSDFLIRKAGRQEKREGDGYLKLDTGD